MKTKYKDKVLGFLKNLFPPVRKLTEKLSASRVAGILGLMLQSGFPMENALQMAPAALADQESIDKVNFIRNEMKDKDLTFQEALSESGLFADFYNRMVKVGAASGHEPQVMEKIAEIYEQQVAGFRRGDGGGNGLDVAHFTQHDDVRRLAQRRAQGTG